MNKIDAPKVVADLGDGYFQDWVRDFDTIEAGVNHCLARVSNDASKSKPVAHGYWETNEEALRIAVQELEQDELDRILTFYFDIHPEEIGDSRAFFERLHATVRDGINNAKQQGSN